MEQLLAQLCGTSALQPLPAWEGDTTGHCFTQLVLSALPHALLAVLSACRWGTPRWVEMGARLLLSMCACRPHWKPTSLGQCNNSSEVWSRAKVEKKLGNTTCSSVAVWGQVTFLLYAS